MGRPPALKQKARSLARRQTAMQLLAKGEPITAIAEQLCVTTRQVRFYLSAALETESFYPSSLDGQQIGQLRQIEGERLTNLWHKAQLALDQIQPRLGSDGERNNDGIAVARLIESGTRVSERIARLFGLDVPTKTVSEVFSLQVKKIDQRVTVSFDPAQIKPDWSIDTGFRRVPPDEDTGVPKLLDGINGNGG